MTTTPFVLHVLPLEDGWKVCPPGNSQPYGVYATRSEAVVHARGIALQHPSAAIFVHGRDGRVEQELVPREGGATGGRIG